MYSERNNLRQKLDKARRQIEPVVLTSKALNHQLINLQAAIDDLEDALTQEEQSESVSINQ